MEMLSATHRVPQYTYFFLWYGYEGEAVVPKSLGRIDLINCMSASTPGLIPEKMLTDGVLMKTPARMAMFDTNQRHAAVVGRRVYQVVVAHDGDTVSRPKGRRAEVCTPKWRRRGPITPS